MEFANVSVARNVALPFELYALAIRDPDRYGWFTGSAALVRGRKARSRCDPRTSRVDAALELAVVLMSRHPE